MYTWGQVRKFAKDCLDIAGKAQGHPTGPEIVLHTILDIGHLGFLVEGIYKTVPPLSEKTFFDINKAMVELNMVQEMSETPVLISDKRVNPRLAKIVGVLKDELHVVPAERFEGGVYRGIWNEVLRLNAL